LEFPPQQDRTLASRLKTSPSDLFIVDNASEWTALRYLREWCDIASAFDIATGYFEIGALLALDGQWQKLEKIRILMGDEVSWRTKRAFEQGVANITERLDGSIETQKEQDDFICGLPAIVSALRSGQIEVRVYRKAKFHAKAYITHPKLDVIGSMALVGSSNFTYPGLTKNIELNLRVRQEVEELQAWYEQFWAEAEEVTPDILRTIERHTRDYTPFEVYAKSLAEYFKAHRLTVSEWEREQSEMYPILDQYQQEGYQSLMTIADKYGGALLCDGVGLGKTFVGLMVIERLLYERKNVALFVPKAAREDVWETKLQQFLPKALRNRATLDIYNHTDLLRGGKYIQDMEEVKEDFDAIIIDEAHHFRNIASGRSRRFYELTAGKQLFFLTATPINNSLYDLMHLIEYFSRRDPGYFREAPLGIHTLRGHFRKMEDALEAITGSSIEVDAVTAEEVLSKDTLFRELVIQRSRAYVKRSLAQSSTRQVTFPVRHDPHVAGYSLAKIYGKLLQMVEDAFNKQHPLLNLGIYNPIEYLHDEAERQKTDVFEVGRLNQVVALIRTMLLKRFESSAVAFEASCEDLLLKLLYFVRLHNPKTAKRWENQHAALMERIRQHRNYIGVNESEEDWDEDVIPEEIKKKIERLDERRFNATALVMDNILDMDQLARFLDELAEFTPAHDDKLQTLITLLKSNPILREQKVLIFTEFINTARYLRQQLSAAGIGPLDEVDSMTDRNRSDIIRAFSPYYNGSTSPQLAAAGITEIRILISTDVLSEGLNLQDATCIINYDLHWNPVRLMQRIGRVDRRLDPEIEMQLIADNPYAANVRGSARIWNFLPPIELNRILTLYERVTHKTLRISKTFGIEGRKLLTPQDDYDALREFSQAYEGQTNSIEEMRLAYQQLLQEHPSLADQLAAMPRRIFSGKAFDVQSSLSARALFFCYYLPAKDVHGEWSDEAALTAWYLYDLTTGNIEEDASRIFPSIRSQPSTPRQTRSEQETLTAIRKKLDEHITKTYLRKVQAPVGIKAHLVAWMELV